MKVVLINPPAPYLIEPHSQCPLGIMYLSAVLKMHHIDCEILNLVDIGDEYVVKEKISKRKDVYWWGITSTTLDYNSAIFVKGVIRECHKDSFVVLGGSHATAVPESCLDDGWDCIAVGEMESTIFGLHKSIISTMNPAIWYGSTTDVDNIPYPDREGIDVLGGNIFINSKHYNEKNHLTTSISFSRGCYNRCAFCSLKTVMGRGIRYRAPGSVRGEVIWCKMNYGIQEYRLIDDCFNYMTDKMLDICRAIKDLGIYWRASFTAGRDNDINIYKELYECGCRELSFGVESADENVLYLINKPQRIDMCREALVNADKAGIRTRILMIMGLPGETEETLQKNIDFCESVPHVTVALKKFVPLPGSPIWDNPGDFKCKLLDSDWKNYNFYLYGKGKDKKVHEVGLIPLIETETISPEKQIENLYKMKSYLENRKDIMWKPEK